MKSLRTLALTGVALLILTAAPIAAQAQEWSGGGVRHGYGCGRRYRDIAWDRHNLGRQWQDIQRDRFELRRDIANGNWAAAQAEREDMRGDLMNARRQRWDLYRDYQAMPGPGNGVGYMPLANFAPVPLTPTAYMPGVTSPYPPAGYQPYAGAYGPPVQYYPSGPNYAAPNGQSGLGALLSNIIP